MPWEVQLDDRCPASKPWGVVKKTDNSLVACHVSQKKGEAQQAALYASEGKAMDNETEMVAEKCGDGGDYVPAGVTSFAGLKAAQDAQDAVQEVRNLSNDFQSLVNNIMFDEMITDKGAAVAMLASEFAALVNEETAMSLPEVKATPDMPPGLLARVGKAIKTWAHTESGVVPETPPTAPPFMLWKEGSTYRWLATYSNKFRDRDRPPEILSERAHLDFVKAIDSAEWPAPELWLWHVPGTRFGTTDWVAYADGFALASGTVDKANAMIAERLESYPALLAVSHGMPVKEIVRDAGDQTVITRYRTREISVLPEWAAANALTGFDIQEVKEMTIPQDKKAFLLAAGMTEDRVVAIEADLEGKAKEAVDAGLEFKATEVQPPVCACQRMTETPVIEPEKSAPPAPAPVAALTAQDVADAVREVLLPINERLVALESLTVQLAALDKSKDERVAEQLAATPAASLADLLRGAMGASRAIGNKETRVDGRSSLARAGPAETAAPSDTPQYVSVPFINSLLTAPRVTQ